MSTLERYSVWPSTPTATENNTKADQSLMIKCARCDKSGPTGDMKTCARCLSARYCSKACQEIHWKAIHKREECIPWQTTMLEERELDHMMVVAQNRLRTNKQMLPFTIGLARIFAKQGRVLTLTIYAEKRDAIYSHMELLTDELRADTESFVAKGYPVPMVLVNANSRVHSSTPGRPNPNHTSRVYRAMSLTEKITARKCKTPLDAVSRWEDEVLAVLGDDYTDNVARIARLVVEVPPRGKLIVDSVIANVYVDERAQVSAAAAAAAQ
jgi:hypothetical protein